MHFDSDSRVATLEMYELIKNGVTQDGMDVSWDESHVAKVVRQHLKEGTFEMASQLISFWRY